MKRKTLFSLLTLMLNEVTDAIIERSSFLSNTHGTMQEISNNINILSYIYLHRDPSLAVGGAFYAASSNVLIVSSNFTGNTAEIGGALFAHNSSLRIIGRHYSYNRASYGGVMITSESTIDIDNCTYSDNAAGIDAGVMIAYRDAFSISGSTFASSTANRGGVLMYLNLCLMLLAVLLWIIVQLLVVSSTHHIIVILHFLSSAVCLLTTVQVILVVSCMCYLQDLHFILSAVLFLTTMQFLRVVSCTHIMVPRLILPVVLL